MFTDHKKFAAAPSMGPTDTPIVYGLPARTKEGPARVVFDEHYVMLVIHGVLVSKNYRRSYHVGKYEALRDEINAAAKRGAA